ncbi:LL-diaminopimelate aminotransferase [candidate division KSB1 bacterium]|nr:LL-diaminopimelate aminotransferase [candidate division KSB1 bacterium]
MAKINANYDKLSAGYLFPEIAKRTRKFQQLYPNVRVLRLGIGDTTEPLPPAVIDGLYEGVKKLANRESYTGYGDYEGNLELREALKAQYQAAGVDLDVSEIFVSDGAKPDSGNIQSVFATDNVIAIQDPAYPVYVDTNVIAGRTGLYNQETKQYDGIIYMPCTEENGFFSDVPGQKVDLIYLCSPNNPTGAVATKMQLKSFVEYARTHKSVIIFDAAYSDYIRDSEIPTSIFQVEGAKECAIEINSFSKSAGFTGVRLGWSVVPKSLAVLDAPAGKVNALWARRQCTFFNGASNVVQAGGLAVLSPLGRQECRKIIDYYMENAAIIRDGLLALGLTVYGGDNAPYIWLKTPGNISSWDFFDKLLREANVVGTPGSGFGPHGEGFFRLSAFGHRENVEMAVENIKQNLRL